MSNASSQANAFYEEVASTKRVFTVLDEGSFLVYPMNGREVVPFWSTAARIERVQKAHPKYRVYALDELTLEDFLQKTLSQLEEEGIFVGVNWSGERLTGYDVSVSDLRRNIQYWRDRLGQ